MTTPAPHMATEAICQARQALQRGDKRAVRHWVELALAQDATLEEPWLLLAAVSTPRASLEYLQHALNINPGSERARQGLEWARQRLRAAEAQPGRPSAAPAQASKIVEPKPAAAQPAKPARAFLPAKRGRLVLLLCFLACLLGAAFLFKNAATPVEADSAAATYATQAAVLEPSAPEATAPNPTTPEPSAPTPTPLPTDTTPLKQPAPEQSAPEYTGGKLILVDLSEQHMYVYENDTLVYSFVVSTGMNGGTRVGTFSILNKIPNAYGSTWDLWMPNWMGIYWSGTLQNGIHALPILSNGQQLWAGYLGTPISYGCVILGVYEAELLYEWAEIGTPVIIQH